MTDCNLNIAERISIQVSLSGFSFVGIPSLDGAWRSPGELFSCDAFSKEYVSARISEFTPWFTLVPEQFFDGASARENLASVASIGESDNVKYCSLKDFGAVLIWSDSCLGNLPRAIEASLKLRDGVSPEVYPEAYWMLQDLSAISDYNKVSASYVDGHLYLAVSQGKTLLLCNSYKAADFTTAEYFIFMVMKRLQLNPEVTSIYFRTPLSEEQESSLYRYFKSVEK